MPRNRADSSRKRKLSPQSGDSGSDKGSERPSKRRRSIDTSGAVLYNPHSAAVIGQRGEV